MKRLFVAVDPPDEIKEKLADLCGGLRDARWTPWMNLHLTLRFIGEVNESSFLDVKEALAGVLLPEFQVRVRGIGEFSHNRSARVLWAGIEPAEPLQRLRKRVQDALSDAGFEPERRKFRPHITLARLKGASPEHVREWLNDRVNFESEFFPVRDFTLMSSRLHPDGARYTPEECFELQEAWSGSPACE